jgi:hypothetical protein
MFHSISSLFSLLIGPKKKERKERKERKEN